MMGVRRMSRRLSPIADPIVALYANEHFLYSARNCGIVELWRHGANSPWRRLAIGCSDVPVQLAVAGAFIVCIGQQRTHILDHNGLKIRSFASPFLLEELSARAHVLENGRAIEYTDRFGVWRLTE